MFPEFGELEKDEWKREERRSLNTITGFVVRIKELYASKIKHHSLEELAWPFSYFLKGLSNWVVSSLVALAISQFLLPFPGLYGLVIASADCSHPPGLSSTWNSATSTKPGRNTHFCHSQKPGLVITPGTAVNIALEECGLILFIHFRGICGFSFIEDGSKWNPFSKCASSFPQSLRPQAEFGQSLCM